MRIGFQIVLAIIILNLVCGLVFSLNLAGTEYTTPPSGTGDSSEYEERFDPEAFVNATQPSVWETLPFLGNIITVLLPLWNAIKFTVFGFPSLLIWFGQMIPDASARSAYNVISGVIIAIESVIVFAWLVQVFSGRRMQD